MKIILALSLTVAKAGFSLHLRYLLKHQRISIAFISEATSDPTRPLMHCPTDRQKGDGFIKGLLGSKFAAFKEMIGLRMQSSSQASGD
jgi:hypothetical protein